MPLLREDRGCSKKNNKKNKATNIFYKPLIFLGALAIFVFLIISFYFRVVLNKPFGVSLHQIRGLSFSFNEVVAKNKVVDEISFKKGQVILTWDGIEYKFETAFEEKCDSKNSLYLYYFSELKNDLLNCYEDGTEEHILFLRMKGEIKKSDAERLLFESKKISDLRKESIQKILKKKEVTKKSGFKVIKVFTSSNDSDYLETFQAPEGQGQLVFIDLVNRINILLNNRRFHSAVKNIEKLNTFDRWYLILSLNDFFFRKTNFFEIKKFYKRLLVNTRSELSSSYHKISLINNYFDLFLKQHPFGITKESLNADAALFKFLKCDQGALENIITFRECLKQNLRHSLAQKLILFKLRQIGDNSLDYFWAIL